MQHVDHLYLFIINSCGSFATSCTPAGTEEEGIQRNPSNYIVTCFWHLHADPLMARKCTTLFLYASQNNACLAQADASHEEDSTYTSEAAVPGTLEDLSLLEDERYTAAALYGLASSPDGVYVIRDNGGGTLSGEAAKIQEPMMWPLRSLLGRAHTPGK